MIKENEKAFPVSDTYDTNEGMDLRDYFAAKAMQAYISSELLMEVLAKRKFATEEEEDMKVVAQFSYETADAMLKERTKNEK
jgi:hypothetical protein